MLRCSKGYLKQGFFKQGFFFADITTRRKLFPYKAITFFVVRIPSSYCSTLLYISFIYMRLFIVSSHLMFTWKITKESLVYQAPTILASLLISLNVTAPNIEEYGPYIARVVPNWDCIYFSNLIPLSLSVENVLWARSFDN